MADYQLTGPDINGVENVFRTTDGAFIPNTPLNRDWVEYQKWLADGGVPDPAPPPAEPPQPETTQAEQNAVLLNHENEIRTLKGDPPLTPEEFDKVLGKT